MWLAAIIPLLSIMTAALPSAANASRPDVELPELVVTSQSAFAIPFRVGPADNPSREPVEVQLYVSSDRGTSWQLYARSDPAGQQFPFRAAADGEYWFSVRTLDRSGQSWPQGPNTPELRVLVHADYAAPSTAEMPVGEMPPGERPRMVNGKTFELEYDVDSTWTSGVTRVELWGTQDGGRSWRCFASSDKPRRTLVVHVDEEGTYGFRLARQTAAAGGGLGASALPKSGDLPEIWIGVDLTKPTARITAVRIGAAAEAGSLIIAWEVADKMLAARPITLLFAESRGGPWTTIAAGLENTGRYAWPIDPRAPRQIYLRLEARDAAGNVGAFETTQGLGIGD